MSFNEKMNVKKIIHILLFASLIIVDVIRCDGNGAWWAAGNRVTGLVIGGLIILHFGIKDLRKWWVVVAGIMCLAIMPTVPLWWYYVPGFLRDEMILFIINIYVLGLAGYLLAKHYFNLIKSKPESNGIEQGVSAKTFLKKHLCSILCLLFLLAASISVDNTYKPLYTLVIFGMLYITPFTRTEKEKLLSYFSTGVIYAFWGLQILAFAFRPFTVNHSRYKGMYSNPNMFALFCALVMAVTLIKIYEKRESKKIWFYGLSLQYAFVFVLMIYSSGRAAMLAAAMATFAYMITVCFVYKAISFKRLILLIAMIALGTVLCVPSAYTSIRYLPTILKRPVAFEGEEYDRGRLSDADYYVSFEKVMDMSFSRVLTIFMNYDDVREREKAEAAKEDSTTEVTLDEAGSEAVVEEEKEHSDPNWENKTYYIDWENGYNDIDLRVGIWRTYLADLNWRGHTGSDYLLYVTPDLLMYHSHNIFVQMFYSYGIPAGVFFVAWVVTLFISSVCNAFTKKNTFQGMFPIMMWLIVIGFGVLEINWMLGQISWFVLLFINIFVGKDSQEGHS